MKLANLAISALETKPEGVLIRDDGQIHTLDHMDLLGIKLRPNDLYIVEPHGEIMPPIALAVRQQIVNMREGLLLHIDAHPDSATKHDNGKYVTSAQAAEKLSTFMNAQDEESMKRAFEDLVDYMDGDICVFLAAMNAIIPNFAAFLREEEEQLQNARVFGPYDIETYLRHGSIRVPDRGFLRRFIEQTRIAIYSIDGDFCGSAHESRTVSNESNFEQKMEFLIDALRAQAKKSVSNKKANKSSPKTDPLYFISVDRAWCRFRKRFLRRFIDHFYQPMIEA